MHIEKKSQEQLHNQTKSFLNGYDKFSDLHKKELKKTLGLSGGASLLSKLGIVNKKVPNTKEEVLEILRGLDVPDDEAKKIWDDYTDNVYFLHHSDSLQIPSSTLLNLYITLSSIYHKKLTRKNLCYFVKKTGITDHHQLIELGIFDETNIDTIKKNISTLESTFTVPDSWTRYKMRRLIQQTNPIVLKFILNTFKGVELSDVRTYEHILIPLNLEILKIFVHLGRTNFSDLIEYDHLLENADLDNLKFIVYDLGITNLNIIRELIYVKLENIKIAINSLGITNHEILAKMKSFLSINPEDAKILVHDLHITNIDELNQFGVASTSKDGILAKNFAIITYDANITDPEQLIKMKGVLKNAHPENLKIVINDLKITNPDQLIEMEGVLGNAKTKNLKIIINNTQIIDPVQLIEMQGVLSHAKPENFLVLSEILGMDKISYSMQLEHILDTESSIVMLQKLQKIRQNKKIQLTEKMTILRLAQDLLPSEKLLYGYIEKVENGALEDGLKFIYTFKEQAKGLITGDIPNIRENDYYDDMVPYIFPSGNYSSHKENKKCADQLDHLNQYSFDKLGYPTQMSGLLGYQLKENATENTELLNNYQKRLDTMRQFITSRGPDNASLQEDFEKKIDTLFAEHALPEFAPIKQSNVDEKIFMLILSEIIKNKKKTNLNPIEHISDLLVIYKYVYAENLENYIQQSADAVRNNNDEISQRQGLWTELSNIYGENMKHTLSNNLLSSIQRSPHYQDIMQTTNALYNIEIKKLSDKQKENIQQIFTNDHITPDKKFTVLEKQLSTLLTKNIDSTLQEPLKREIANHLQQYKSPEGILTANSQELLENVVPQLFTIQSKYLSDIGILIDTAVTKDINDINQELDKYEEVIEVENKKTKPGGEKEKTVKKQKTKRDIIGYFTKTKETANARMGAYLCIAGDHKMRENPNYFELVMKDQKTGKCIGVTMLLNIQANDGKKYLRFGPNPFESLLTQVSSKECYDYMYRTVRDFAQANNYDGVVVPSSEGKIQGACTNRGGDFPGYIKQSVIRNEKGGWKVVRFGEIHHLGLSYDYEDGALVWEKKL